LPGPDVTARYHAWSGPGRRAGLTGYLVVVGPETDPTSANTPFEPARGIDIREITDGASNTVLVIGTDRLVPWTKPDDLRWSRGAPLPHLASPHDGGAHVLFADGVLGSRWVGHPQRPGRRLDLRDHRL
jgi:prepilin-type processing-associated H-X9-DG protein